MKMVLRLLVVCCSVVVLAVCINTWRQNVPEPDVSISDIGIDDEKELIDSGTQQTAPAQDSSVQQSVTTSVLEIADETAEVPKASETPVAVINNWGQWRGPLGTGVGPSANPPTTWSEENNIRWKLSVPGKGHATPIIWGDRIYLTTAVPFGDAVPAVYSDAPGAHDIDPITQRYKFTVMAVDRDNGAVVWERVVREALPHEGAHKTASLASNSPVTDGEHVFASFGSHGLYCFDLAGKLLWEKDLGVLRTLHSHGEGSSPVLHKETLIIVMDHEGDSFVIALDKRTGAERWRVPRIIRSTAWTTPIVIEHAGTAQVIVSGSEFVRGYDLATGQELWKCGGLSVENVTSSPVSKDGLVFVGSSYDKRSMIGIRIAGASGDITGTKQVLWSSRYGTPYVPSPLLYDDALYYIDQFHARLTRVHAESGVEQPGMIRLTGIYGVFASPVGAAGRVYVPGRNGATIVLKHSDAPDILALNTLDDNFSASPALVGTQLFLRGEKFLYCIEEAPKTP